MKTVVVLVAFFTIFVSLNPAIGGILECHKGGANSLEGTDPSRLSKCLNPSDQCVEATCTALDQHTYKFWDCIISEKTGDCSFYKKTTEEFAKSKNVSCHCKYGEKGKSLTNVPSSAAKNRLRCKAGTVKASGEGRTYYSDCLDGYEYCYAAYCAKAKCYAANYLIGARRDEHVQTMWGCSKNTSSCDALNVAVSAQIDSAVKCECTFGEKGVPYVNRNFPISTTTTQTPTTSTTTTTTTTTTKMTTTKTPEKPMTTMTTFKAPMSITGQPMTTTAEENCSASRRFAIFWPLLVAIGILA